VAAAIVVFYTVPRSGTDPKASYRTDCSGSVPRWHGADSWTSLPPLFSVDVRNMWSCKYTPTCCHVL